MQTKKEALEKLGRSKFRSSFHLRKRELAYVREKGLEEIKKHAADIIRTRLAPAYIENDGKQTPMKNHPVFIAQHACACCCRGCLHKWYNVPINTELTQKQQEKIVALIMAWIEQELENEEQKP
ncbi:MAG: DUF4186 domain-containing protein [Clostridia bacterium]|nr:DUF4186 domain-containing protein [Clostridia bacterium]MBR0326712.1 DUF4186 domain-containing protein [Clostridia bacterium]